MLNDTLVIIQYKTKHNTNWTVLPFLFYLPKISPKYEYWLPQDGKIISFIFQALFNKHVLFYN